MIVVDTNVVAYLYISGRYTSEAEKTYRKDPDWAAPLLWRSEFRNVLAGYVRRNHLSTADAMAIMAEAESLLNGNEFTVDSESVFPLLIPSGCSAYDCEFVALAKDLGVSLVTTDKKILSAFPETAVSLRAFVSP